MTLLMLRLFFLLLCVLGSWSISQLHDQWAEHPMLAVLIGLVGGGLFIGEFEIVEWRAGKEFHRLIDDIHCALLARELSCRSGAHSPPFVVGQRPCPQ